MIGLLFINLRLVGQLKMAIKIKLLKYRQRSRRFGRFLVNMSVWINILCIVLMWKSACVSGSFWKDWIIIIMLHRAVSKKMFRCWCRILLNLMEKPARLPNMRKNWLRFCWKIRKIVEKIKVIMRILIIMIWFRLLIILLRRK